MSVFSRLNDLKNDLSKTENNLMKYILINNERIPSLTAKQISNEVFCSAATVVRFTKKIGYPSFTEFKIALSTENRIPDELVFSSIDSSNSFTVLKKRIAQNGQFVLKETTGLLQEVTINRVIEILEMSDTIYVFGVGASSLTAENILQKWTKIGKNIVFEKDLNILVPRLSNDKNSKNLFIISNSGETSEAIALARLAKLLSIKTIALTRLGVNSLSRLSDYSLQTSQPIESSQRSAATNSLISQFLLVDILFYSYINKYEFENRRIVDTKENLNYLKNRIYKKR